MSIKVFSAEYLGDLVHQAAAAPRRRQHRNFHADYADPCQRLFNAIDPESYTRPHRDGPAQGAETMIAVRGLLALVVFDDDCGIEQLQRIGAGAHTDNPEIAIGAEIPPGKWHTVVALETGSVILEIKAGPFDPGSPKFPASWAPEEGTAAGSEFLARLMARVVSSWCSPGRPLTV
jgi:cupin fold WbuC family metalloprotein